MTTPPTTPRLTAEQEQELQALAAAATPGPWCYTVEGEKVADYSLGIGYAADSDDFESNLEGFQEPDDVEFDERLCYRESAEGTNASADFAFIAAARTAVPALLASLSALRAELAEARAEVDAEKRHAGLLSDYLSTVSRERDDAIKRYDDMEIEERNWQAITTPAGRATTRTPTDAMVERAAEALRKASPYWFASRDSSLSVAHCALTAALGGDK